MKKIWIVAPLLGIVLSGCDRQGRFSPVDMWNRSRYKPLEPEPFFPDGSSSRPLPVGTVARGQLRIDETLYQGRKRGSGVAPNNMDYGYIGNGGNIGGTFNGAGPAGTENNFNTEGNLGANGDGSAATNTGSHSISALSGSANGFGGSTTGGSTGMSLTSAGVRPTSESVTAAVGGDGVSRAVGDNGLGNDANLATDFPFPVTQQLLSRGQERYNIYCSPCHARDGGGNGMIVQRGFSPPPSYHIARLQNAPVGHFFDVITHGYGAMYPYASRVEPRDRWAIIAYIRLLQQSRLASGVHTPQMDTPRSYPSPGTVKMQGSNIPGMTGQGMGGQGSSAGTAGGSTMPKPAMPKQIAPKLMVPGTGLGAGTASGKPLPKQAMPGQAVPSNPNAARVGRNARPHNRIAQIMDKSERGTATR